ncbi:type II toxin-antitoxin system VapC family toxin [Sorangium sp. So ce260]|uniref:type II toxin-antitoxin system VapC family toxin n=1 Tax=Sorangium sp. So ce260 TaxID=3133291 RepID=UPI003F62467F
MKPRVYIETSILSYLTARPSRDLIQAAHQQLTIEWWAGRNRFELVVSDAVLAEASRGDPSAAARRLAAAEGLPVLSATTEAQAVARRLLETAAMPRKAAIDAAHVAIAAVHDVSFLLTWNCTHLANAMMRRHIETVCRESGYWPPIICTPEELAFEEKP